MYTNGPITKGFNGLEIPGIAERIYLFEEGNNKADLTGCWDSSGYSLFNSKTIVNGHNTRTNANRLAIVSPGLGQPQCVLMGTQAPIPTKIKRYLAIEAQISDQYAASDFKVIISKQKALAEDTTTRYFHLGYQEEYLKFYIDLSELADFTQAYIAIAGGALGEYWNHAATLNITRIYLTNKRDDNIRLLYNRGNDYSSYSAGQNAGTLVGWEAVTGDIYVAPTFESEDIDLAATDTKVCAIKTTRNVNLDQISGIYAYIDVYEKPEGTQYIDLKLSDEGGWHTDTIVLGKQVVEWSHYALSQYYGSMMGERKITISAETGIQMKIYAIWIEQ